MNQQLATITPYIKNAQLFVSKSRYANRALQSVFLNGHIRATDHETYYSADIRTPFDGVYSKDSIKALLNGATVIPEVSTSNYVGWFQEDSVHYACVTPRVFAEQLSRLLLSASEDATRFALNGVCFELDAGGLLIATDGHRLHAEPLNVDSGGLVVHQPGRNIILPADALTKLVRCLKATKATECYITIGANSATFGFGAETITMRQIEGRFPDWRMVVPTTDTEIVFDRKDLLSALKRLDSLYTKKDRHHTVVFECGQVLAQTERGKDCVEIESPASAAYKKLGIDARYLLDAIDKQHESKRITLRFTRPVKKEDTSVAGPVMVNGTNPRTTIIMPIGVD